MGKRDEPPVEDGEDAFRKRQKISHHQPIAVTTIESVGQLRKLLTFSQDVGQARQGIQSFKVFLDGFAEVEPENSPNLKILTSYLDSQIPPTDDKTAVFLQPLIETWKYAAKINSDPLLSAVPAVLALLLRTISRVLKLADHSIRIGRTVLQPEQQDLIAQGLSARESKEYVISPCIRLLREVVLLGGGSLAKQLFRGRELTLKSLPRNLKLRYKGDGEEDINRPSIRTNALRFVLTLLKFLPRDSKLELIAQRDVSSAISRNLRGDPPVLVLETIDALTKCIITDDSLPREARTKFINALNLGKIAGLYQSEAVVEELNGKRSVSQAAHEFLLLLCTSADYGMLFLESGFYPRGIDPDDAIPNKGDDFIDLGVESIDWIGKFVDQVPIRNRTLSEFMQTLRPWTNKRHSELILGIFQAAPELVADYFFQKKDFSYDPKLTVTWIGFSSFLFSVIQLPVPRFLGRRKGYAKFPPPTAVVMESIFPLPLSQKALTKCLHQKSPLIRLFAIRVMTVAFEKLRSCLASYQRAAVETSPIWTQAAEKLIQEFSKRCPSMKDAIQAFRDISEGDVMQREAIVRLLAQYYEIVPDVALDTKFSISDTLAKALQRFESGTVAGDERGMRLLEVEHLFRIAYRSPDVRWSSKLEFLNTSPFMALLNFASIGTDVPQFNLEQVLHLVVVDNGILQSITTQSSLQALIVALKATPGGQSASARTKFLEYCVHKCATSPVKYADTLEQLIDDSEGDRPTAPIAISLLLLAITEEWPSLVKSSAPQDLEEVAQFIAHYLAASFKIKEDKRILKCIVKKLSGDCNAHPKLQKTIERCRKLADGLVIPAPKSIPSSSSKAESNPVEPSREILDTTQSPKVDPSALNRWVSKDVEEVVEDGHLADLAMLLTSEHLSVRKEALTNLSKLAMKLKESQYVEKDQFWLLICELVETARPHVDHGPLPTTIPAFVRQAADVVKNPIHFMYAKINKFLTQAPEWEIDRIPLMKNIFNEPPTLDDAYYREFDWLLEYLLAGLWTPADMAVFHKRRIFERLLSMYSNPYLGFPIRKKILQLLVRATSIPGGSTTLITRFGILSWLKAQAAQTSDASLEALQRKLLDTCETDQVERWSNGAVSGISK